MNSSKEKIIEGRAKKPLSFRIISEWLTHIVLQNTELSDEWGQLYLLFLPLNQLVFAGMLHCAATLTWNGWVMEPDYTREKREIVIVISLEMYVLRLMCGAWLNLRLTG